MKKIFRYLMKPIIFISIIYFLTFLLCKYWKYVEDSHIDILTYSREDGYGITDDGQLIDWSHIRCFEGPYARTSYNSIDQIKCEDIIIISQRGRVLARACVHIGIIMLYIQFVQGVKILLLR